MSYSPNRIRLILFFILAFQCALIGRLFYLQIIKHDFYSKRVAAQLQRVIPLPANRGQILDRNGKILVTDIDSYSLYVHPQEVKSLPPELAERIGVPYAVLQQKLQSRIPFVWIKRHLSSFVKQDLEKMNLTGFGFIPENQRLFVLTRNASHIIGYVGTDHNGLGGIEYKLNKALAGKDGKLLVESDPYGRQIAGGLRLAQKPLHGKNVYLTIDLDIQQALEDALTKGLNRTQSARAMGMVMDSRNGEILAMSGLPNFDPNEFWKFGEEVRKNPLVGNVYEPGSTFKSITIAAGLNEGIISTASVFYCPNQFEIGGRTIGEAHHHDEGNFTVNQILMESLNVGAAKIGVEIGPKVLEKYIYAFGFGQTTGVELPGESPGIVRPEKRWSVPDKAIVAFGQGIAVTPLQLMTAYTAFLNQGSMVRPTIIKRIENQDGTVEPGRAPVKIPVLSAATAESMKDLLVNVVEKGTGIPAQIPGFWIGGKTGTAQKAIPGGRGYMAGRYVISFIGFLPVSDPKVIILAILDDPQLEKWGSSGTGPVFNDVARACIKYLHLTPDRTEEPALYTVNNQRLPFPALLKKL